MSRHEWKRCGSVHVCVRCGTQRQTHGGRYRQINIRGRVEQWSRVRPPCVEGE